MNINHIYNSEYVRQLELAYGEGMMSEGGVEEIDFMFTSLNLKNKTILDFGSGLGGASYYLAKQYDAIVTGIEINPELFHKAQTKIPPNLKNRVNFVLSDGSATLPFKTDSFDVIFSRGVIVHLTIAQRGKIFMEFHRLLKPRGKLIIHDWLSPYDHKWSEKIHHLMQNEHLPLHAQSPESYTRLLQKASFTNISMINRAAEYARYNKEIAERLNIKSQNEKNFAQQFGVQDLQKHINDYLEISAASTEGELLNMFISAEKA